MILSNNIGLRSRREKSLFLIQRHKKLILFVIYLLLVGFLTLWKDVDRYILKWIYQIEPVPEYARMQPMMNLHPLKNPSLLPNKKFLVDMIANFILFFPMGFLLPPFIKNKYLKIIGVPVVCGLISISIELLQSLTLRYPDINDIIMNSLGGFFGFFLYWLKEKFRKSKPALLIR